MRVTFLAWARWAVSFVLVLAGIAANAEYVRSDFRLKDGDTAPANLTVETATGSRDANQLLADRVEELRNADFRVIFSDFSEAETQALVHSAEAANSSRINTKPPVTLKEKLLGWTFVGVQSGAFFAFAHFSKVPPTPLVISTLVALGLNSYFRPEKERWPAFQRWGAAWLGRIASKLNLQRWSEKKWFSPAAESLTGSAGTFVTSSIFIGLSLWDKFVQTMLHEPETFFIRAGISTGLLFFLSQPFDTVFSRWLNSLSAPLDPVKTRWAMRLKSIIVASLMPMILSGNEWAMGLGVLGGLVGWKLYFDETKRPQADCEAALTARAVPIRSSGEQ